MPSILFENYLQDKNQFKASYYNVFEEGAEQAAIRAVHDFQIIKFQTTFENTCLSFQISYVDI